MTPYDTAADLVLTDAKCDVLRDHIAKVREMESSIDTYLELGGNLPSVWARLSKTKEME